VGRSATRASVSGCICGFCDAVATVAKSRRLAADLGTGSCAACVPSTAVTTGQDRPIAPAHTRVAQRRGPPAQPAGLAFSLTGGLTGAGSATYRSRDRVIRLGCRLVDRCASGRLTHRRATLPSRSWSRPHTGRGLGLADQRGRLHHQEPQQPVLWGRHVRGRRQRDRCSSSSSSSRRMRSRELGAPAGFASAPPRSPSIPPAERLGDVVVPAQGEALDAVGTSSLASGVTGTLASRRRAGRERFEPVAIRHHHVRSTRSGLVAAAARTASPSLPSVTTSNPASAASPDSQFQIVGLVVHDDQARRCCCRSRIPGVRYTDQSRP